MQNKNKRCSYCKESGHFMPRCEHPGIDEIMNLIGSIVLEENASTANAHAPTENAFRWLKSRLIGDIKVISSRLNIALWRSKRDAISHIMDHYYPGYIQKRNEMRLKINRIMYLQARMSINAITFDELRDLTIEQIRHLEEYYSNLERETIAQIAQAQAQEVQEQSQRKFEISCVQLNGVEVVKFVTRAISVVEQEPELEPEQQETLCYIYVSKEERTQEQKEERMQEQEEQMQEQMQEQEEQEEQDDECQMCAICLEDNTYETDLVTLNCNHQFCGVCLETSFKKINPNRTPTCALCRQQITVIALHRTNKKYEELTSLSTSRVHNQLINDNQLIN